MLTCSHTFSLHPPQNCSCCNFAAPAILILYFAVLWFCWIVWLLKRHFGSLRMKPELLRSLWSRQDWRVSVPSVSCEINRVRRSLRSASIQIQLVSPCTWTPSSSLYMNTDMHAYEFNIWGCTSRGCMTPPQVEACIFLRSRELLFSGRTKYIYN